MTTDQKLTGYTSIDKHAEYATIRQEILDTINARDNYVIAMYTITAAILCAAFELQNPILFLIPYIILYAFQNAVATKTENMIVLAAYIAVFLEEGVGWESNNYNIKEIMHKDIPYKRANSIWKFLVGRISSVQLGMLCSIACTLYSIFDILAANGIQNIIEACIYIVLAIILYVLIRIQTNDILTVRDRRNAYIENLQKAKKEESHLTSV